MSTNYWLKLDDDFLRHSINKKSLIFKEYNIRFSFKCLLFIFSSLCSNLKKMVGRAIAVDYELELDDDSALGIQ